MGDVSAYAGLASVIGMIAGGQCMDTMEDGHRKLACSNVIKFNLTIELLNGLFTSYIMGGLIHILLIFAVVVILIRVIQNQRLQRPWNSSLPPAA